MPLHCLGVAVISYDVDRYVLVEPVSVKEVMRLIRAINSASRVEKGEEKAREVTELVLQWGRSYEIFALHRDFDYELIIRGYFRVC